MRRKRNLLILTLCLTGAVAYYVQLNFINVFFSIGENVPDLLLIVTVFVGGRLGQIPGSLYGFTAGLFQDALIDFYGIHALCKTVVGFAVKFFGMERVMLVEKYYFPVVVFACAILHSVIFNSIQSLDGHAGFWALMLHYGLGNSVYSGLAALVLRLALPAAWVEFIRYDVRYEY